MASDHSEPLDGVLESLGQTIPACGQLFSLPMPFWTLFASSEQLATPTSSGFSVDPVLQGAFLVSGPWLVTVGKSQYVLRVHAPLEDACFSRGRLAELLCPFALPTGRPRPCLPKPHTCPLARHPVPCMPPGHNPWFNSICFSWPKEESEVGLTQQLGHLLWGPIIPNSTFCPHPPVQALVFNHLTPQT